MQGLLLYSILTAALFYLGSRAVITQAIWNRYPRPFAKFMDCAACSGTWYGAILAATVGRYLGLDLLGLDSQAWSTPIVVALVSMVTTPIVANVMQRSLLELGDAVGDGSTDSPS